MLLYYVCELNVRPTNLKIFMFIINHFKIVKIYIFNEMKHVFSIAIIKQNTYGVKSWFFLYNSENIQQLISQSVTKGKVLTANFSKHKRSVIELLGRLLWLRRPLSAETTSGTVLRLLIRAINYSLPNVFHHRMRKVITCTESTCREKMLLINQTSDRK